MRGLTGGEDFLSSLTVGRGGGIEWKTEWALKGREKKTSRSGEKD